MSLILYRPIFPSLPVYSKSHCILLLTPAVLAHTTHQGPKDIPEDTFDMCQCTVEGVKIQDVNILGTSDILRVFAFTQTSNYAELFISRLDACKSAGCCLESNALL